MPRKTKDARLAQVIALQEEINQACQQALVGTVQEVLVDGKHPRKRGWMNGRTDGYRAIAVKGEGIETGDIVRTRVTGHEGHWLVGEAD